MENRHYRLKYVLVGASGAGKSTMAAVLEKALGFRRCITSTTRPPRPNEVDGKDYYFRSALNPAEMFEHARFGSNEYGITFDELARGDFIILEPQGVRFYREHFPGDLTVIQLQRSNIHVDADRMARDNAAGFDSVCPDFTVTGETVDTMAANLLSVISLVEKGRKHPSLDDQISSAQRCQNDNQGIAPNHLTETQCPASAQLPAASIEQERV